MKEIIMSFIIFISTLMWIDLVLSFISKEFNELMIHTLQKQNELIEKRKKRIKFLFNKVFKK